MANDLANLILEMNHHRDRDEVRDRQVQYGEEVLNVVRSTLDRLLAGGDTETVEVSPPAYSLFDPLRGSSTALEDAMASLEAEILGPDVETNLAPAPDTELEGQTPENNQVSAPANDSGELEDQPEPANDNGMHQPANDNEAPVSNEIPVPVNKIPVPINEIPLDETPALRNETPSVLANQANPLVLPAGEVFAFPHAPVTLQRRQRAGRRPRGSSHLAERRQFLGPSVDASDTDTSSGSQLPRVINLNPPGLGVNRMDNAFRRGLGPLVDASDTDASSGSQVPLSSFAQL
ncbi:hypothetical protein H1R20_g2684, partial [Candolleomyces eurysporus]